MAADTLAKPAANAIDAGRNFYRSKAANTFGTDEPEVFVKMLDRGMYDGMYEAREEQKKIAGQSR